MPRGKKAKRQNNKDVLTTRLMQISLKMDDHIYSNKLITVNAAEEYLREVASLKLKCPRTNVRALQVIEKLTRCMKSIITENKEHGDVPASTAHAYTENAGASSPVYSLPDEDRTQLLTEDNLINDDQIIDLTGDIIQEPVNLIEKVKIALSKMGLQEEPMLIADDCSQSILDNFQGGNAGCTEVNQQTCYYLVHVPNNEPQQVIDDISEMAMDLSQGTALEQDCSQNVLNTTFCNENTKCNEATEATQERELEIYQYITSDITQPTVANETDNSIPMNDTLATRQSTVISEASKVLKEKSSNVIDLIEEPANKPAQTSKTERKKGQRKKKKQNTNATEKRTTQTKIKNLQTAKKENHLQKAKKAFNVVLGKGVIQPNIRVDKSQTVIYNENVECDLSWVENLRYVREISPEENDITLSILDDHFWNNFNLPANWDDRDFKI